MRGLARVCALLLLVGTAAGAQNHGAVPTVSPTDSPSFNVAPKPKFRPGDASLAARNGLRLPSQASSAPASPAWPERHYALGVLFQNVHTCTRGQSSGNGSPGEGQTNGSSGQNCDLKFHLNGFAGFFSWFFSPWGLEVEVSAVFGTPFGTDTTLVTYAAGPVVAFREHERWQPWFHALFGGSRLGIQFFTGPFLEGGNGGFAWKLGGGLDVKFAGQVGLRLVQVDYLYMQLFGQGTHGICANSGLIFRF